MPKPAFDIVLFDLGGVLMDPGGVAPMRQLARIENDDELWERWLTCRWVRSFERGHCGAEEFASGIVDDWELDITPGDFLRAFTQWPKGPYPGAPELVQAVRSVCPVGCLSNTNVVHWDAHVAQFPFVDAFDHRFLSCELGMVKPDLEIFEEVATRLEVPAHRILFLDDNTLNVDAAGAAGFVSVRAQGVEEARNALVEAGILEG
jgi:putative hydrolase of the HAD superfamily